MAKSQGEIARKPRLSLVAKYSIFSLLAFLTIGGSVEWWLIRERERASLGAEIERVEADSVAIGHILGIQSLEQGIPADKLQELEKHFVNKAIAFNTVRANIWSPGGKIVYSNIQRLIGQRLPMNGQLLRALKGETVTTVTRDPGKEFGEWESSMNVLRGYVPLRLEASDKVSGVYEAQMEITPLLRLIREHKKRIWLATGVAFFILYFSLFFMVRGASKTISQQQCSLEQAYEAEREKAAELALLLKTSESISSSLNLAEILDTLAEQIVRQIGVTFCRILLLDRTGTLLTVHAAYPIRELNWEPNLGSYFRLDSLPLFKKVMEERQPSVMVSEVVDEQITASERNLTFNAGADAKSVLVLPIVAKERALGVITIGESRTWERSPFSSSRIALCMAMGAHAAVAIENAMIFADRERAHIVSLETLVAALDAREHETRNHSRRVATRTMFLATQMELDPADISLIYRGALLHDVGKIGIPDSILLKNGPLTEEEWAIMKRHPEIGYEILKETKFLGQAREMVLCHHERYDGSGYPRGLQGEAVPLGSRIFAVIDALDAITYDRPYAAARPFAQARQEIINGSGSQFDPKVVEAFLKIPEETIFSIG